MEVSILWSITSLPLPTSNVCTDGSKPKNQVQQRFVQLICEGSVTPCAFLGPEGVFNVLPVVWTFQNDICWWVLCNLSFFFFLSDHNSVIRVQFVIIRFGVTTVLVMPVATTSSAWRISAQRISYSICSCWESSCRFWCIISRIHSSWFFIITDITYKWCQRLRARQ